MGGLWLVVLAMGCHLATSVLLDCTFENGTCGYTVLKDQRPGLYDVMEWRLGQATEKQQYYDLKLLTYGPDVDHTSAQPYGSLMYAVRPINPNTNTTLLSPITSGRLCYFEFFYHMGSRSLKNITTYVVKYGQWIKLGTFSGYQGYEWNRALYDIEEYTRFGEYQLAIVATEPDSASWTIGYALDDLRGMECNVPISCDFEKDMCDFEVERDYYYYDRMEWLRGQASIATWFGKVKLLRNGPDGDHTKNNSAGYFAYAQKPLSSHTNTTLVSPKQTRQLCWLEFYYFMAHPDLGNLDVYLRKDESQFLLWRVKGNQGAKWNRALIDLERDTASGSYELAIFASEPTSQFYSIGYAIDDINAYECACANSPCLNGGTCRNQYKSYNCSCPLFFSGLHCEHDDNPCHANPCMNGATCTPYSPTNYTCACRPGWTGSKCETDIDECASQPCANGALCINGLDVFDCFCDPGWTGERCETEIDECASVPCFNGGTCTDRFNGFNCSCPPGFTGTQCDVNVDECASSPCQHGSFCFDQVDGYLCICLRDYTGTHCEVRRTLDCDFEGDQCGYKVTPVVGVNATDIKWTRGPVSSPSLFGNTKVMLFGPNADHSTGTPGGYMMYAKDGGPDNVTTTMTSPLSEGELCYLQFFYHMGSSSLGRLTVDIVPQNGTAKRIFSSTGFHGFEWNRAQVDIEKETASGKYQFRFEVQEPAGSRSGVGYGIDDIRGLSCNMDMSCDFEDDLCNYYVEMNNGQYYDAMEWRRGQPTLETVFSSIKLLRNGPDTDHTTNSKEGWFMYALKPVNNGTTTMLVAPRQRRQYCYLSFWYHMGSAQLNNLTAAVRKDNETIEVYRISGYQGNVWRQAIISIEDATRVGRYELVIEADQPDGMFWTVGYAVDDIDVKPCLCELTPCMNGGTCHNTFGSFMCQCPYLYGGDDCSLRRQPCDYVPCQHGATCDNIPTDDYNCTCSAGWRGKNCEVNIDECVSFPCQNGGTCVDGVNAFTCNCPSGFYGDRCQFNVDECISRPCLNGAVCVDGIDSFTCECAGGFFGVFCQFEVNECESAPCQHNGTCIDDVNFYSCNCAQGYTGQDCEQEVDECASAPCQHGSMCVDKLADFDCFCKPGYTGSLCQHDVNECWSNPCLNGASCRNLVNSLQCACAQGFTGELCETEIDECQSQPCQHDGTCEDQVGSFKCHCTKDYTGDSCEKSLATDCGLDPCG